MGKHFSRFSDWFALFGLVILLVGMFGTARQFKELAFLDGEPPPDGFLPITVELEESKDRVGHAPQLAGLNAHGQNPAVNQTALPVRPTSTPFQPGEWPVDMELSSTPVAVSNGSQTYLPSVSSAGTSEGEEQPLLTLEIDEQIRSQEAVALPEPVVPDRIDIPVIGLDAPIVGVVPVQVSLGGRLYEQWAAPNKRAAGWHERSTRLGESGNVVINGHHNIYGNVFAFLKDLNSGDEIILYGNGQAYRYRVAQVMILEERYASIEQRTENARWILPSDDQRLTLVTCWPERSNTHRLIVVASPEGNP
jgi:LPXTG-site transpeptidase (sortase) family protein